MYQPGSESFKRKYNHCKIRIKQWEDSIKEATGKDPSKQDFKDADPKIKTYYKLYWKLKGALLEETILGTSSENVSVETAANVDEVKDNGPLQDVVNSSNKKTEELSEVSSKQKNDPPSQRNKADGPRKLTKPCGEASKLLSGEKGLEPENDKKSSTGTKWFKKASSKLFETSSFKKRNPRKSLTQKLSSSQPCTVDSSSTNVSFMSDVSFQSCASPLGDFTFDENSFSVENEVSPKIKSLIGSSIPFSPIFASEKLKTILNSKNAPQSQPVSFLNNLPSEEKPASCRKLDVGWIDRCSQNAEKALDGSRPSIDSGFESTSGSFTSPTIEKLPDEKLDVQGEKYCVSSDDELIWDSDDDLCSQPIESTKRKCDVLKSPTAGTDVNPEPIIEVKKPKYDIPHRNLRTITQNKSIKTTTSTALNHKDAVNLDILEKKVKSGTLNENYVKINMKKKVYARGKRTFNFGKHKKSEWKKKTAALHSGGEIGGLLKCYKCGDVGHYARRCMASKEDKLLPVDETIDDDPGLPSLEEAEESAREATNFMAKKKNNTLLIPEPEALPEDLPELEDVPQVPQVTVVPTIDKSDTELFAALHQFGHDSFRPGQKEAVERILAGKSTLLMLSTGGGKSLCYQLPAYLYHKKYPCIALIVSPLVSLMDDQVLGMQSSKFKVGCLHGNQTEKLRASVLEQLKEGSLCALLVSPEAVVSCDNLGFGSFMRQLPPIAFACIDEVHCVSQWSYNFRPSYLMLTKVLRERFGVKTFLGLTATASKTTVDSIVKELGISDSNGVIQDTPLPSHLNLRISTVDDKDAYLLKLVKSAEGGATLVYCTRRDECVRLAALIRTALRGVTAQPYHAGLVAGKRKSVQRSFMQGKLQVVVATVAFGMGINKQDIRCVFHYNMPKDWESYVQEVGRAGRDGKPAHCHLMLDPKGNDQLELRRHIYSNAVDRHVLRRLLARLFVTCSCTSGNCAGHEVAFAAASTVQALDLPEENIATLLCYLELHPGRLIQVLTPAYMMCKVSSYHGPSGLHKAARTCPPLAVAATSTEGGATASSLSFNVIDLARKIGWDSGTVKRHLKKTEWKKNESGAWRKTGMHVSFTDLGLRVLSKGDLTPEQLDEALDYLVKRVEGQQRVALDLLQTVYSTFRHFSTNVVEDNSDEIKEAIRLYFKTEKLPDYIPLLKIQESDFDVEEVAADVRHLVCTYRDNTFNGRAVARIFHGIQSPNFPASSWFRARQWRAHLDKPFDRLQLIATKEILRLK